MEQDNKNKDKGLLSKIFISGSGVSSKRIMGAICIMFAMILSIFSIIIGEIGVIDTSVTSITIQFLAAGVTLFGVTSLEKFGRHKD